MKFLGILLISSGALLASFAVASYFEVNQSLSSSYTPQRSDSIEFNPFVISFCLFGVGIGLFFGPTAKRSITSESYESIQVGDSIDWCISVLGFPDEQSTLEPLNTKVGHSIPAEPVETVARTQYYWENDNGVYCEIIFKNDIVHSKRLGAIGSTV